MKKKQFRSGIVLGIFCIGLVLSVITGIGLAVESPETTFPLRLEGANRYETAANIALHAYPDGADTVILARGDVFSDGLAGSALAGALDAPILLTRTGDLPPATAAAIEALGATEAVLLGGPAAITEAVAEELAAMELTVSRVYGENRYATAAAIAAAVAEALGDELSDRAFVVSGDAPADSLVAGPFAAAHGYPILMVARDNIPPATAAAIDSLGIENIRIIGGENVVGESIAEELSGMVTGGVERVSGDNRYATSVAVAEMAAQPQFVIVANGRTLVDAIAGGYLGALYGAPILYVNSVPEAVENYLNSIINDLTGMILLGGENAVSSEVEEQLGALEPAHSTYAFSFTLPEMFFAGEETTVPVTFATTKTGSLSYDAVRFEFSASGEGDVTFTATDSSAVEHSFTNEGTWGPSGGFPLPADYSATTGFTLELLRRR